MTSYPAAPARVEGAPLDERDLLHLERASRLLRTLDTRELLTGALPDTTPPQALDRLAAACRIDHIALMVFATGLDAARAALTRRGMHGRPPFPSTVVRERVRRRSASSTAPAVHVLPIPLAGPGGCPREIEVFVLTDPQRRFDALARDERLHRLEDHLAVTTGLPAPRLPRLYTLVRDGCRLQPDGGGHNGSDGPAGRTVLYFSWARASAATVGGRLPHRLELALPGRHENLLRRHLAPAGSGAPAG
ncbi:hypothetical protein OG393_02830 [Streptomyces sp. NBC_01216]|uniref:hypothetical protein n=1 Tax=Streptomyces sp. NBC_01216 TaxID=2903778 RepID=UPI002E11EF03|nr:hypothetical protein OG393_02830 [Streptomyces sp. NBC_01216]